MLLFDFFLGEGQTLLAARNFVPSNSKVPSPFGDMPIRFIDPAEAIDKQDPWTRTWEETITKRAGK
jgi:iron(III) transport system substrate-binding protein